MMAQSKSKSIHACQECGHSQSKWFGRCPACGEWNTAVEETAHQPDAREQTLNIQANNQKPLALSEISTEQSQRITTGFSEVDRVLGGGVLPGATMLLGGEPGIGKSTLLLQIAEQISNQYGRVLYISGEESPAQIKLRADRLGAKAPELLIKPETRVEAMIESIREIKPFLAIVDSIQTTSWAELSSSPGSVAQVRDCASLLIRLAKETDTPIILVGHVTKEGQIAGPRVLEHLVDVVLYFEGDVHQLYRLLRGVKNRFGAAHEVGVFEMAGTGLHQVANPASVFCGPAGERAAGTAVTAIMEGARPLLIEVQALAAPFHGHGFPRRASSGVDNNRLAMILAVLEKRLSIQLGNRDIFVNVTGGVDLKEPAGDLGIAAAILSSYFETPVPPHTIVFGEIGLTGEVRPAPGAEHRLREARQLGYTGGALPELNAKDMLRQGVSLDGCHRVKTVEEVKTIFFQS
ncbi:MAG: DNA repair protein RadA [Candidatus Hinthialibacter antarcticus]|nr:DNA repair protein RadA [Candidatus Hinthialibacter antarcticus]